MKIPFFNSKEPKKIFSEFATKGFEDAIDVFLSAIATTLIGLPSIGKIIGAGAKGLTEALLAKTSEVEKKLNLLLKEPLFSGITLLNDALLHTANDTSTIMARDNFLHDAHLSFTKASIFVIDSVEDQLFINALDLISLCAHSTNWQIAKEYATIFEKNLTNQIQKLDALVKETNRQVEKAEKIIKYVEDNPYRDVPFGYAEQKLFGKSWKHDKDELVNSTNEYRNKINILVGLNKVAKLFFESNCTQNEHG
jgi:hypothetical protein